MTTFSKLTAWRRSFSGRPTCRLLSATFGYLGEWEGGDTAKLNLKIRKKAEKKGIATGVVGTSLENAKERQEQGFKMVALGSDAGVLIRSIQESLDALGRKTKPHLWF